MAKFEDLFDWRETITNRIISDSLLTAALTNLDITTDLETAPAPEFPEDLQYNKVFPYKKSLDTLVEKEAIITLDLSFAGKDGNYFKDASIIFFVICHEDIQLAKYKNSRVLRTDFLASRLDVLFNQTGGDIYKFDFDTNTRTKIPRDIGIGKLSFKGFRSVDNLPSGFTGVALVYTTIAFS